MSHDISRISDRRPAHSVGRIYQEIHPAPKPWDQPTRYSKCMPITMATGSILEIEAREASIAVWKWSSDKLKFMLMMFFHLVNSKPLPLDEAIEVCGQVMQKGNGTKLSQPDSYCVQTWKRLLAQWHPGKQHNTWWNPDCRLSRQYW